MQQDQRPNPFKSNRTNVFSATDSLLTYGDQSFSLFSRLNSDSKLYRSQVTTSTKTVEQNLLWKYEKEFYSVDETGHSLAEELFQKRVESQKEQKEDFWSKIVRTEKKNHKINPFAKQDSISDLDTASNYSKTSRISSSSINLTGFIAKTSRQSKREQILKLRTSINLKKKQQLGSTQATQKFSVLNMYKKKKTDEEIRFSAVLLPVRVQAEAKIPEQQNIVIEQKFQYPQSIFIREQQYFFTPLG